ncbi:MAG TPA: sigma 54-interacting transcriptional regulator [Kofleriaceae bacterium]|nr:sigma 54-interacting transcriptional regulator [Kofleriaceae bacterium]
MCALIAVADTGSDRFLSRIPFFAPVVASRLRQAWATNLSTGGIGLTGFLSGSDAIEPGDELELEFVLGDVRGGTGESLCVLGRVAWTGVVGPDGRLGLGVQFRELPSKIQGILSTFIEEHRPRVLVALASADEKELARRSLLDLELDFVDDLAELDEQRVRACASVMGFPRDGAELKAFVEAVTQHARSGMVPGELPLPPITLCTTVGLDRILPLFGSANAYEVFRPPYDRRALSLAVERSCKQWAMQLELRWASLQLEGIARRRQVEQPSRAPELPSHAPNVIRVSPAMQKVYELIGTVAGHDVPVLLTGETGTGKEMAAREIHARSRRAKTLFVAQDCGALTETLLESELFGHVRGAFTGAMSDHPGLFQIADGGTIFLDEVQNMPLTLQAKLLRVVEVGEVRPVGGAKPRTVDVRLIVACNVDLREAVKQQRFRSDFYYRLNRFPIDLPPLREHVEDILPLTRYFVKLFSDRMGRPLARIDARVESSLLAYDWPGNIRELKNAIERALLLTPLGEPLRWDALPDDVRGGARTDVPDLGLEAQVEKFEGRIIQMALDRNGGVIARAARELRVNAVTLSRKMKRLGLLEA